MMNDGSYYDTVPLDPTYGQRSAYPNVYDEENEDTVEALTYLRSVRAEADAIPNVMGGKQVPSPENGEASNLGFYEDGTYTGTAMHEDSEPEMSENQQAYYGTSGFLFDATRAMLAIPPSPTAGQPAKTSAVFNRTSLYEEYLHDFLYTSPAPRELAGVSQEAIMHALERYASITNKQNFLMGEQEVSCLGAWGWSLLAKCREVGQLDSDDVSKIREMGKALIRLSNKLPSIKSAADDTGGDLHNGNESDTSNENQAPRNNERRNCETAAKISLDILLTIIGDEFGQRDLLSAREIW